MANTTYSAGGVMHSLPAHLNSGEATISIALRLEAEIEANVTVYDFGVLLGAGAYVDLIEYMAEIKNTPDCFLSMNETVDLNIGAFFEYGFEDEGNSINFNQSPSVVTTLLSATLPPYSSCATPGTTSFVPAAITAVVSAATSQSNTPEAIISGVTLDSVSDGPITSTVYIPTTSTSVTFTTPTQTASFTAAYTMANVTAASTLHVASASGEVIDAGSLTNTASALATPAASFQPSQGGGARPEARGNMFGLVLAGLGLVAFL